MASSVFRSCRIFCTQLKVLPWTEVVSLFKKTLYFDEPILIYKQDIVPVLEDVSDGDGIQCVKGTLGDLEQLKNTVQPPLWEFQCRDFDGVDDFFVAKDEDGIQHISWIYRRGHPNRILSLGVREAELKYGLTLPAKRGRGIMRKVLVSIFKYLESIGFQRVYVCVHRDNSSSIRGIEKSGFIKVGEIRLRKVLGMQISPRFDTQRRVP